MISKSSKMSAEYCATVVRIGEVVPVPDSDFLGYTLVEGFPIVVRKDQVKSGDIMIYCQNETALNLEFLGANNSFDWESKELNSNYSEVVKPLLDSGNKDEAKKHCGFINKHGRIRIIKLRGQVSMGILFSPQAFTAWKSKFSDIPWETLVGTDFDTISDELFCKAYVPPVKAFGHSGGSGVKDPSKKFDRIIPGTFNFHYDTANLQRNAHRLSPQSDVSISVKLHGTSAIFACIPVRVPKYVSPLIKRLHNIAAKGFKRGGLQRKTLFCPKLSEISKFDVRFGNVYSSRSVIKNKFAKPNSGFYGSDIWGDWNLILKDLIPQGWTVYGEIVGFLKDGRPVQKGYDYGCAPGESKFMPYRISVKSEDSVKEYSVSEVIKWTEGLIKDNPKLSGKIIPLQLLYSGKLSDRYPGDLDSEGLMKSLESDLEFGMEGLEPLCNEKVPREGFCLRFSDSLYPEAFKCKCKSFLFRESKQLDSGDASDLEMGQRY